MLLAAVLTLSGPIDGVAVPALLREAAFAAIGLQIGLKFERDTVRSITRLLLPVTASILALGIGSFGLAYLLTLTADVSLLNAYLATTPGGLIAVLPIAFGSGGDAAFVLAVQGIRIFVMVLAAPVIVRMLVGTRGTRGTRGTSGTAGTAGAAGAPDKAGTAGVPGTAGTAGAPDTAGTAGTAGTPGTPEPQPPATSRRTNTR
jgi:hypothetical protein